jgi:hypothetical protein
MIVCLTAESNLNAGPPALGAAEALYHQKAIALIHNHATAQISKSDSGKPFTPA